MHTKATAPSSSITADASFCFFEHVWPACRARRPCWLRADLMARLRLLVQTEVCTQAQAAQRFGIAQSRVSDLLRGQWDKFSLDMLVTLAARAGRKVELAVV